VAAEITSAGQSTNAAAANVSKTHGTVCSATSTVVVTANQERAGTATAMSNRSAKLADALETAADRYEFVDQRYAPRLDAQMRPN
jgi:Excreted virulence factor EspC, type VII ESX diderm